MPALREGILINQPAPRPHRANRRPLYIAIGALSAVFILLGWAWSVRSNMKALTQAKAVSNVATPATSAIKTLDKQWADKLPKRTELASSAPLTSASPQPVALTERPHPLPPAGLQPYAMNPQAIAPAPGYSQIPQVGPQEHTKTDLEHEQLAAWDSPLVPNHQVPPQQESRATPQLPDARTPHAVPMSYMPKANGEGGPGDEYLSQNLQESKKEFAGTGRNTFTPIVADSDRLPPYVVKAGWDIPAILEQAANSDLPGELRARVRENVYDTATGRYLLIPQNSILVGKYNPDIAYAQNRIQVNWERLLRPGNEPTIFLNQMNGVDSDGSAGLTGPVNNHYKRLIGFAILSSAFAAGIEVSQTHNNNAAYGHPTAGQMAAAAVGTQMGEFGRQITERNLNRPPTILLKPGTRFNVRVNRDIIFVAPFH